ncbi:MAG: PHP domain-containing protein [SAR324 cluster bacterium]|nr:PHP domain-containing protein [SAR324 cluster bacterium]
MTGHVPLWCKSNHSFLEGASHPEELVETAHRLGLPALALTDRDGVYGVVRAHTRAKELGLPLLIGAQVTLDDDSLLLLLAQNRQGYANLCRLITIGRRRSTRLSVCPDRRRSDRFDALAPPYPDRQRRGTTRTRLSRSARRVGAVRCGHHSVQTQRRDGGRLSDQTLRVLRRR